MREVAQLADVSTATVSRVLSGLSTVKADHRKRVLEAVDRIGYRPNRIARNLRRQRAEMIGVVVPDIENPHFSEAVSLFEEAAFSKGYRLLLCSTGRDRREAARLPRDARRRARARRHRRLRGQPRQRALTSVRARHPGRRLRPRGQRRAGRHRPLQQHRCDPESDGASDLDRPQTDRLRRRAPRPRDRRRASCRLHRRDAGRRPDALRRRRRLPHGRGSAGDGAAPGGGRPPDAPSSSATT